MNFINLIDKIFGTKLQNLILKIKAEYYFNNFNFKKAIPKYENLLKEEGIEDKTRIKFAVCLRHTGQYNRAFSEIKKVQNLEIPEYYIELGRLYLAKENPAGLEYIEKALELKTEKDYLIELAQAAFKFNKLEKSLSVYENIYHNYSQQPPIVLELVKLYYYTKKYGKCEEFLDIYEDLKTHDELDNYKYRGLLAETTGDYEKARLNFEKLIFKEPENEIAFEHLSFIYENTSNYEALEKLLQNREKLFPGDLKIKYRLGSLFLQLKKLSKARTCFEILIENNYFDKKFIQKYLEVLLEYRDYIRAEKLCLNLIDSQVFTRSELSAVLSEIYLKTGKISLFLKYMDYEKDPEKYRRHIKRFKNVDKELIYGMIFKKGDKFEAITKCEFITLDKVISTDKEIINNFLSFNEDLFLIGWNENFSTQINTSNKVFYIEKIIKNIPVCFKNPENVNELEDIIKQVIDYFRENEKVFQAYIHMAREKQREFYFFIKRFLNTKLTTFNIEDFLEHHSIRKEIIKNNEFIFDEFCDREFLKEKNIYFEAPEHENFNELIYTLLKKYSNKFLFILPQGSSYEKLRKKYLNYNNFIYFGGNYICLYKLREIFKIKEETLSDIVFWLSNTFTGLLAETNLSDEYKNYLCASDDNCLQLECPYYEKCYFQLVKRNIFKNRIILTDCQNLSFFEEKIESALIYLTPELIQDIFSAEYLNIKKFSLFLNKMELYFEINLKNNSQAFNFYRKLKESIIKIDRLTKRIYEISSLESGFETISARELFESSPEIKTYFKRFYSYGDLLKENLYNVESYLNKYKLHIVELNFFRNGLYKYIKKIEKIINNSGDFWIKVSSSNYIFYNTRENCLKKFTKKIFLNNNYALHKSFSILKEVFKINKQKLNFNLPRHKEEVLVFEKFFYYQLVKNSSSPNVEPYLDYYSNIYQIIKEQDVSNFLKLEYIQKKYRSTLKQVYRENCLEILSEDISDLIFELAFIGKTIFYINKKILPVKLIEKLKKNGFPVCLLSYDDRIEDYETKVRGIKNGFYKIVFSTNKELFPDKFRTSFVFCTQKEGKYFKDHIKFIIKDSKKPLIDYKMEAKFFHARKIIDKPDYKIISYEQLKKILFEKDENNIEAFLMKKFNYDYFFSTKPDFNLNVLTPFFKELVMDLFWFNFKNKKIIVRQLRNKEINYFELLLYLYSKGVKINYSFKVQLNKESAASEKALYKNLLSIIEMLEYFNSFDEIRVFGKKEFNQNHFDFEASAFFWLFKLEELGMVKMEFINEKFRIIFNKKIENLILFIKEYFNKMEKVLKILKNEFNIDISTYTNVNIFDVCLRISDMNYEEIFYFIYAINYMGIIDSEPLNLYFSKKLKIK
ncbi:MAG: hypothetical protein ACQESP_07710 [Candidatus Muiribacteriota bacterium]